MVLDCGKVDALGSGVASVLQQLANEDPGVRTVPLGLPRSLLKAAKVGQHPAADSHGQ